MYAQVQGFVERELDSQQQELLTQLGFSTQARQPQTASRKPSHAAALISRPRTLTAAAFFH